MNTGNQNQIETNELNNNARSVFEESIDSLSAEDISAGGRRSKGVGLANAIVRYIIIYVSMTVFFVSLLMIGRSIYNYQKASEVYDDISDYFNSENGDFFESNSAVKQLKKEKQSPKTPDFATALMSGGSAEDTQEGEVLNENFELVKAKLHYLATKNPDLYGWIKVDGTAIDYPLVQAEDNQYYLNNDFYGEYLPEGSIYVDYRCDDIMDNQNTVIYGHNMVNGSMFGSIPKYLRRSFFDENKYVTLTTFDGIYKFEIFAIYETDMYYSYIKPDFATDLEFVEWAERMRDNSVFVKSDLEFDKDDRILTLSTCTNGYYIYRYALQAVLVEYTEYGGE